MKHLLQLNILLQIKCKGKFPVVRHLIKLKAMLIYTRFETPFCFMFSNIIDNTLYIKNTSSSIDTKPVYVLVKVSSLQKSLKNYSGKINKIL